MALEHYQLVFPQSDFEVCEPKPNIQQIAEAKTSQSVYQPTIWSHNFIHLLDDNFPVCNTSYLILWS